MFDVLCETLRRTGFQWKVFDNIVSFDRELLTKLASGNPQVYISQIRHCFFIKSCFKGFQVLGRFSGKTQTFHQGIKNVGASSCHDLINMHEHPQGNSR